MRHWFSIYQRTKQCKLDVSDRVRGRRLACSVGIWSGIRVDRPFVSASYLLARHNGWLRDLSSEALRLFPVPESSLLWPGASVRSLLPIESAAVVSIHTFLPK